MAEPTATNITWHDANVSAEQRESLTGQKGAVLWFTGLSGSGKSTISRRVEQLLLERGVFTYGLDGDNVRFGLNSDLGFAPEDRQENIRRISEVAKLFADSTVIVCTAFISPYRAGRNHCRNILPEGRFVEVFVDTPLEVCASRDPKGLYKKAMAGEIKGFTGIDAPYEAPLAPEVHIETVKHDIDGCAQLVVDHLIQQGFIPA